METLQALTTIIKDLPQTALWILILFFIYKTIIVGSIYGVIRFTVKEFASIFKQKQNNSQGNIEELISEQEKILEGFKKKLNSNCIDPQVTDKIFDQLLRIKDTHHNYIFSSDVGRLKKALDMYEEKHGLEKNI
ncbi:MAG: hypothetical protein ACR2PH_04710 [Desulfobulbia bacterium]